MQTRSKTRLERENENKENTSLHSPILPKYDKYEVNIDFDEASKEWRKNKTHLGNGMYKYKKTRRPKNLMF